jgi:hypothetical protein
MWQYFKDFTNEIADSRTTTRPPEVGESRDEYGVLKFSALRDDIPK